MSRTLQATIGRRPFAARGTLPHNFEGATPASGGTMVMTVAFTAHPQPQPQAPHARS